jgi:hypothetical protein
VSAPLGNRHFTLVVSGALCDVSPLLVDGWRRVLESFHKRSLALSGNKQEWEEKRKELKRKRNLNWENKKGIGENKKGIGEIKKELGVKK